MLNRIVDFRCMLVVLNISFFFLFDTFLEEYFPEYFLFLLVRVIILHIVIRGLVKDKIAIVIAVGILIPYPPLLLLVLWSGSVWTSSLLSHLGSQKEYSFVKPTYDRDLDLLLLLLLLRHIISNSR